MHLKLIKTANLHLEFISVALIIFYHAFLDFIIFIMSKPMQY